MAALADPLPSKDAPSPMDISFQVYNALDITVPPRPNIFIDEEAELSKPKPCPLREPHPVYNTEEKEPQSPGSHPAFSTEPLSPTKAAGSKHESYNLSGSVFLVTADGRTLDLPIPSDSKLDPLNWGWWKRARALFALWWYSVVTLAVVQAASLMMPGIVADFGAEATSPWTPETLVTAPTLFMGIGAFVWVPLSLALGRRPVFLVVALANFGATVGAGYARSFGQLLFFVCLMGVGEGFALTSVFLMIIDMTFIGQRPKAIAALWSVAGLAGTGALQLVPYLSDHGLDWHLFYRRWSLMTGIAFVLAFVFYPETYFKRPTVAFDGLILMQSATEKLTIYEDLEAESSIYRDVPSFPFSSGSGQTLRCRLGLTRSPFASWRAMGRCYIQILFCVVNPLIFWVLIASSFNFAGMMFIGATYPRILASPPYTLPSALISGVSGSSGVGSLLAYPFAAFVMCKILTALSKRNRGVREAEHYLIGYVLPVLTGALSTLIYGLAVSRRWHFTFFYLAYGLNGFSWVLLSIGNTLWVTEAFPRWAAPALVVVGGGCYLISFTMSFALIPWVAAHGYLLVGVELALLQLVGGLIALPIAFWGKSARQKIHGRWASDRSGAVRPL